MCAAANGSKSNVRRKINVKKTNEKTPIPIRRWENEIYTCGGKEASRYHYLCLVKGEEEIEIY